ncbi:MAG: hypothetical protein ACYCSW_11315, partial [bacterium]
FYYIFFFAKNAIFFLYLNPAIENNYLHNSPPLAGGVREGVNHNGYHAPPPQPSPHQGGGWILSIPHMFFTTLSSFMLSISIMQSAPE